jgi:hypothetical protein
LTAAGLTAFFKTRYPQREIENLVKFAKPTMEAMPMVDDLEGDSTLIPFQLDVPQGQSASLQKALTNVTSSVAKRWVITPAAYYGGLTIDAKSMRAARSNVGAWIRLREREYEGKLDGMGQEFERALWGDGTGSLGTLLTDPGTGTSWQLVNATDAINLHIGMKFSVYANSSGVPGTARSGTNIYTVTNFNEDDGTFTTTEAADASIAVGDHIVRDGDVNVLAKGIPAWITRAAPTSATFFGLDRTTFPQQKAAGWRGTWKGTIEETVKALDARIRRANQRGKAVWLSYANFNRLDLELGARGMRDANSSSQSFGSATLKMTTPGGGVVVKCGPYVPEDSFWLLDMSTWTIHTLDTLPHIVDDDGLTALRIGGGDPSLAQDGIEIRLRGWWQPVCDKPYANGSAPIS